MPFVDARPAGLNLAFRPGTTLTVDLTWPAGFLAGRTFTSTLGAANLAVAVVGDVMTVEATQAQTDAVTTPTEWLLLEDRGGAQPEPVIRGVWSPSDDAAAHPSTVTVITDEAATVEVTVSTGPSATVIDGKVAKAGDTMTGPLIVQDDVTFTGQILTGTFGTPATFGGIEREGRVFPAGEMCSPTAVMNFGDGFPRVNLPSNVTTDVYMIIEIEEWWLDSTIGVYFEWVNDHTAADGAVRFDCEIKECDIHTEALAAADVIASRTFTHDLTGGTGPAANTATTSIVASIVNGNPVTFDPGPIASFYVLRISRLGADAADTLAGPIGLLAASMTRGQ